MCVFSRFAIRLVVPYEETGYSYKFTVVDIFLLLTSTISSSLHSINGVYLWFLEGKQFLIAQIVQDGISFRTPFPKWLWIHQVYCL